MLSPAAIGTLGTVGRSVDNYRRDLRFLSILSELSLIAVGGACLDVRIPALNATLSLPIISYLPRVKRISYSNATVADNYANERIPVYQATCAPEANTDNALGNRLPRVPPVLKDFTSARLPALNSRS